MKKARLFLLLGIIFYPLSSQSLSLDAWVKIPLNTGEISFLFSAGPYYGSAPREITFINGRSLFVAQTKNGIIFDIYHKKAVASLDFPRPDNFSRFENGEYFTFSEHSFVSINVEPTLSLYDSANYSVNKFQTINSIDLLYTKSYYLHDMYFFYKKDGKLVGLTTEGRVVSTQEVITKQLEWQKNTWYASSEKRGVHKRLIETGNFLIVDGIFYPSIRSQARDYFAAMGIFWSMTQMMQENVQLSPNAAPIGVTLLGEFGYSNGVTMVLYNHIGDQLATIDTMDKNQRYKVPEERRGSVGSMRYAIHPNGDFYALQSIKDDSNYFYRTLKTWGTDLIKMAREGVTSGSLEATKKVVQNLSNQELKLLRNTFFALQGYVFTTWELKNYFLGYEWYQPNPTVTSNTSGFTLEQKKLFDLVVAEENRRQAEVVKLNSGVSN